VQTVDIVEETTALGGLEPAPVPYICSSVLPRVSRTRAQTNGQEHSAARA